MLEEAIAKALAALPRKRGAGALTTILEKARDQLGAARAGETRNVAQQVGEAADLMHGIYGSAAVFRAELIAEAEDSTEFSQLVLVELQARASRRPS